VQNPVDPYTPQPDPQEEDAVELQPITNEELVAALRREFEAADSYNDWLRIDREMAWRYYNAQGFGNEVDGRSQIVLPDVQEAVDYMAPSVIRTIVSSDRVVEFEATDQEEEDAAEEATAAIGFNFLRQQDGYGILIDFVTDGLIEKIGIIKSVCQVKTTRSRHKVTDLVQLDGMEGDLENIQLHGPDGNPSQYGEEPHAATLTIAKSGHVFLDMPVPGEEFRFSPLARHEDEADYIAHVAPKTRSELVEMGFDRDQVYSLPAYSFPLINAGNSARNDPWTDAKSTPALEKVLLCEEYTRIDRNNDGIAERIKTFRVENSILIDAQTGEESIEEVEDQPFTVFTPYPRPHRLVGYSLAEKVMDLQVARSTVARQLFDGMYNANMPRPIVDTEVAKDAHTIDDLLNPVPGAPIRAKGGAASVQPYATTFDVGNSLQVLEWVTGERESRTGITRLNQGLDADALNKMLCVETPVPFADGSYKRLGDVVDGDIIVGSDGRAVKVERAHTAHFPVRAYDLKFASGEVVRAGGEHLWTVQTDNDRRYSKTQTVDTDTLAEMLKHHPRVYIPRVVRPQTGAEIELPLDPYMLGIWLGDGSRHAPRITTEDDHIVSTMAAWCIGRGELKEDKHQNSGNAKSYYVGGLYPVLRNMKMLLRGDAAKDADIIGKHIPEAYFAASYDQRMKLLQGLMDTDGCLHSNSLAIFCQKTGRLLDDVVRLIESLGGWPKIKILSAKGRFAHSGEHAQVFFTLADCPFKIGHKANRWHRTNRNLTTQIVEAAYPTAPVMMRCLTVDAEDGLFCVGKRFTVTHNTATGTAMMQAKGELQEEFVARNLTESLARMFSKKYRMMKAEGQPFKIKVDGQYKQVDPSTWPDEVNVTIRVGLGTGSKDKRINYRMQMVPILSEGLMQKLTNPQKVFNMIDGLVRDMNIGTGDDFWVDPNSPEGQQAAQQAAQQPQQPDPAIVKAQMQASLGQQQLAQKTQLAQQQIAQQEQANQAKMQLDAQSHAQHLAATQEKYALELDHQRTKAALELQLAHEKATTEANIALYGINTQAKVDTYGIDKKAEVHTKINKYRDGKSIEP
jgi:hypothetical protein